jgi:AcrR family transcriptional regulator
VGRPRDATIDERVLEAARELLVEVGFDATTLQAIAERSGVHASAIYRRWPSRVEIIEQVVFPGFESVTVEPTGDLLDIIRAAPPASVDRDVDADDVFGMLLGAIVARTLIPTVSGRSRPVERLVDMTELLLRGRATTR